MKVKVSEASGVVLDWLVAECEGHSLELNYQYTEGRRFDGWWQCGPGHWQPLCSYSTNWAAGGPIIEREGIGTLFDAGSACREPAWFATPDDQQVSHGYEGENFDPAFMVYEADGCYGPTSLIASMRCFVTSRLGPEVEVPDELLET